MRKHRYNYCDDCLYKDKKFTPQLTLEFESNTKMNCDTSSQTPAGYVSEESRRAHDNLTNFIINNVPEQYRMEPPRGLPKYGDSSEENRNIQRPETAYIYQGLTDGEVNVIDFAFEEVRRPSHAGDDNRTALEICVFCTGICIGGLCCCPESESGCCGCLVGIARVVNLMCIPAYCLCATIKHVVTACGNCGCCCCTGCNNEALTQEQIAMQ